MSLPPLHSRSVTSSCGRASVALDPEDAKNLVVTLSGHCNETNITVTVDGVLDDQGDVIPATVTYGKLIGDVDESGAVDVRDGRAIRTVTPALVNMSNFRDDLNLDGKVNAQHHKITQAHFRGRLR